MFDHSCGAKGILYSTAHCWSLCLWGRLLFHIFTWLERTQLRCVGEDLGSPLTHRLKNTPIQTGTLWSQERATLAFRCEEVLYWPWPDSCRGGTGMRAWTWAFDRACRIGLRTMSLYLSLLRLRQLLRTYLYATHAVNRVFESERHVVTPIARTTLSFTSVKPSQNTWTFVYGALGLNTGHWTLNPKNPAFDEFGARMPASLASAVLNGLRESGASPELA